MHTQHTYSHYTSRILDTKRQVAGDVGWTHKGWEFEACRIDNVFQ